MVSRVSALIVFTTYPDGKNQPFIFFRQGFAHGMNLTTAYFTDELNVPIRFCKLFIGVTNGFYHHILINFPKLNTFQSMLREDDMVISHMMIFRCVL